jgi:hypothetical protein
LSWAFGKAKGVAVIVFAVVSAMTVVCVVCVSRSASTEFAIVSAEFTILLFVWWEVSCPFIEVFFTLQWQG